MHNLSGLSHEVADLIARVELAKAKIPAFYAVAEEHRKMHSSTSVFGFTSYTNGAEVFLKRDCECWTVTVTEPKQLGVIYKADTQERLNELAQRASRFGTPLGVGPQVSDSRLEGKRPTSLTALAVPDSIDLADMEIVALLHLGSTTSDFELAEICFTSALALAATSGNTGNRFYRVRSQVMDLYRVQADRLKTMLPHCVGVADTFLLMSQLEQSLTMQARIAPAYQAAELEKENVTYRQELLEIAQMRQKVLQNELKQNLGGTSYHLSFVTLRRAQIMRRLAKYLELEGRTFADALAPVHRLKLLKRLDLE